MPTLYLCPSGISLAEHCRRQQDVRDLRSCVEAFVKGKSAEQLMSVSAEINSLIRFGLTTGDRVVFLCSDTEEGPIIADILAKVLENNKHCKTFVRLISGLQTKDKEKFDREGIPNLTEAIITEYENYRYQYNIVLNATAGYKAAIPYLTLIGMIFHLPIRYVFEYSESIIDLPPVPIEFDMERLKQLEPVIDEIAKDYVSIKEFRDRTGYSYDDVARDSQDILLKEDDYITLRPVGRILYQRYLQFKGYKVYYSLVVDKKLESGKFDRTKFESLFAKMRDPVHLQGKLHSEVKKKGMVDLECYKAGSTNERIFFYVDGKGVYICDIFMHDEYEREIEQGGLLRDKFKDKRQFKELKL